MDRIYGHTAIKQGLCHAAMSGRMHHAYLFTGPLGVGKFTLARAFVQTMYCEKTDVARGIFCACGTCDTCRRVLASVRYFDDVRSVDYKDSPTSEPNKSLAGPSMPDYYEVDEPKQVIKVDLMRDLQQKLAQATFFKDGHRYVIIRDIHKMQPIGTAAVTANCFLKTLEEPDPSTTFILTTSQIQQLLPTIVSRCQIVRFGAFSTDEVVRWLGENVQQTSQTYDLSQFATMSSGSIGIAKSLMLSDSGAEVTQIFQKIITVHSAVEAMALATSLKGKKSLIEPLTRLLNTFLRDVLVRKTAPNAEILLTHHETDINRCARASLENIVRAQRNVDEIYGAFMSYANEQIAFDRLILGMQGVVFMK